MAQHLRFLRGLHKWTGSLTLGSLTAMTTFSVMAQSSIPNSSEEPIKQRERKLLKQCIDIAMDRSDDGKLVGNPEAEWIDFNSGNSDITVQYRFLPNDSITTIRGYQSMMDIIGTEDDPVADYYTFCDTNFDDVLQWEMDCDELSIEKYAVKQIDDDHSIIYSAHNSGVFGVSSRDFCYMKSRHLVQDFVDKDGIPYDMACSLCYSVDGYIEETGKHVRGRLKNCGYIFMRNKQSGEVTACYVLHLDPGGWLPTWVINIVAPKKGMMVNKMLDNFHKIREFLAHRT